MEKELIYFLILGVLVIILIIALVVIKKIDKYRKSKYQELVKKTELYFQNLSLKDNKYLEYVEKHGATIDFTLSSKGDVDLLSQVEVKNHYRFFLDKVLYIFNDQLKLKPQIEKIDNKEYFIIDGDIKRISVLASFEGKSHILVNYLVKENEDGYYLVIDESKVDVDE